MARQQVPDLQNPEPLTPPPPTTDLFPRNGASRPPIDNRLGDLANALSSFAPALNSFSGASAMALKKQQAQTDQAQASQFIAGHTNDEYKTAARNGQLPVYADPVANGAIQKNYGKILGDEITQQVKAGVMGGQINLLDPSTNVDQLITQNAKGAIDEINQRFPTSKFAAAGLAGAISPLRESLLTTQEDQRVKANLHARLGVVSNTFNSLLQNAQPDTVPGPDGTSQVPVSKGEVAQQNIRQAYTELGKTLDIPPQWMDQQLISVIKNNATTNPEVAYHLLNAPRTDASGNKLPSLAANPAYAKDIMEVVPTLNKAMGEKYDQSQKDSSVQATLDALHRGDGSVWQLHDKAYFNGYTNKNQVIGADEIKKDALAQYQTASDLQAQQRHETSDTQFERDWTTYHAANMPNPAWTKTLEGVAETGTNPAALSNPDMRQKAIQSGELWMKMGERDYNYLAGTLKLDTRSKDFYDTYEVARRYMGQNQDQAVDTAGAVVNKAGGTDDLGVRNMQKAINQKVTGDFGNYWPYSDPGNLGEIQKRVTSVASTLVRVDGMKVDDAITNASKLIHDRSYQINGHSVIDQGYMPPPDMQKYVGEALTQFAKQHGEYNGVTGANDLSITPAGGGNWRVTLNDGGPVPKKLFVLDNEGHAQPAVIKMSDLHMLQQQDKAAGDQAIITKQGGAADQSLLKTPPFKLSFTQQARRQALIDAQNQSHQDQIKSLGVAGGDTPLAEQDQVNTPIVQTLKLLPQAISSLAAKASAMASRGRTSDYRGGLRYVPPQQ